MTIILSFCAARNCLESTLPLTRIPLCTSRTTGTYLNRRSRTIIFYNNRDISIVGICDSWGCTRTKYDCCCISNCGSISRSDCISWEVADSLYTIHKHINSISCRIIQHLVRIIFICASINTIFVGRIRWGDICCSIICESYDSWCFISIETKNKGKSTSAFRRIRASRNFQI